MSTSICYNQTAAEKGFEDWRSQNIPAMGDKVAIAEDANRIFVVKRRK